jgi:AhpD family alkylhydroperoxidase
MAAAPADSPNGLSPSRARYERLHGYDPWAARRFFDHSLFMTEDLKSMSTRREEAHAELLVRDSAVYRAFLEMEQAAFADGVLPKKVKELIAVGISVVINCESCMQWHIEQAAAAGATEREVLEAIEFGIEMGGGPATAHARFALGVMTSVCGTHGDT